MVIDFSDAFYLIHAAPDERGWLTFSCSKGWAVFQRICFGMATAPLIWGRVAAAAARIGQAAFGPNELRIQMFVDDPAVVAQGSLQQRRRSVGLLLLLWSVLGLKLNWPKGQHGSSVDWIGTSISLRTLNGQAAVRCQLTRKKSEEVIQLVKDLHDETGMVASKRVLRLAGILAWTSGLFPHMKAYNAALWATISATRDEAEGHQGWADKTRTSKKRPSYMVFVKRFRPALQWIHTLFSQVSNSADDVCLGRWFPLTCRLHEPIFVVRCDAAPSGMGAILFKRGKAV